MNHPIAQIAALVCHGNAVLRGLRAPRFFPNNSTCRFCDRVDFVRVRRGFFNGASEIPVAATPDEWFELVRRQKAKGLLLLNGLSDVSGIAARFFIGSYTSGDPWRIAVLNEHAGADLWLARWSVRNQDAPEQRIWRVTYGLGNKAWKLRTDFPSRLNNAMECLRNSLAEMAPFARKHQCDQFADSFDSALRMLRSNDVDDVYHKDIAPTGALPREAAVLLAACQKAWVFGGMGSWNDLGFQGAEQAAYLRLTKTHFDAVNSAIVVASNCSLPVQAGS